MKKILMTLAAVLCCAMISTTFTACSSDSDNESISDYAAYDVKVYTVSSINSNCADVVEQMKEALNKKMDGKMSGNTDDDKCVCKRNDQKAISICDEAFQNATRSGTLSIVLKVTPFGNGLNNETTDLKIYRNL